MEHIRYKKETEVVTFQGGAGSGKTPGAGTAAL